MNHRVFLSLVKRQQFRGVSRQAMFMVRLLVVLRTTQPSRFALGWATQANRRENPLADKTSASSVESPPVAHFAFLALAPDLPFS
jgi:hypothetical protein